MPIYDWKWSDSKGECMSKITVSFSNKPINILNLISGVSVKPYWILLICLLMLIQDWVPGAAVWAGGHQGVPKPDRYNLSSMSWCAPGSSPGWATPKHLPREMLRKHRNQMWESTQLALFDQKEKQFYFELLTPSLSEASVLAKETDFSHLYLRFCSFGQTPKPMTTDECLIIDWLVNWELAF